MDFTKYGIVKVVPNAFILRAYLQQCGNYTDKRCFNYKSSLIDKFCRHSNWSEMDYDSLILITKSFKLSTKFLYYFKNLAENPVYYESVEEIMTPSGILLVLKTLGGQIIEFANFKGIIIDRSWHNEIEKISWLESLSIENYEFQADHSILVWFVGRCSSWAVFEYTGINFLLRDAGSSIGVLHNPNSNKESLSIQKNKYSNLFNLTSRIPNENDLRAYLHQIITSEFDFSIKVNQELSQLSGESGRIPFEKISLEIIREILYKHAVYPRKIYFFNTTFESLKANSNINKKDSLSYKNYPELFTTIKEVSFDEDGYIVLEFFEKRIYKLYSSKGHAITSFFRDIKLLTNGGFVSQDAVNDSSFKLNQYNQKKVNFQTLSTFSENSPEYSFLPYLNDRDLISEMYYPNFKQWLLLNSFSSNANEEEIKSILSATTYWTCARDLVDVYYNDMDLALIVLKHRPEAFSLLSETLKEDIDFILLALSAKCHIYNYLKTEFRNNKKIVMQALTYTNLNGEVLMLLPDTFKLDKDLLLLAISNSISGKPYETFPEDYKKDSLFVEKVLAKNGRCIEFITEAQKGEKNLVMAALRNYLGALSFASLKLKKDKDLLALNYQLMEDQKKAESENDLPF